MRITGLLTILLLAAPWAGYGQAPANDQVPISFVRNANPHMVESTTANAGGGSGKLGNRSNGSVLGVDSIPNWSASFYDAGLNYYGGSQFTWQYTMAGHSPFVKNDGSDPDWTNDTTTIGAPVIPVSLDLRNYDGSPRYVNGQRLYSDATGLGAPVLKSPVFGKTDYDSSQDPTQFADAVQRAEFFHKAGEDWHTLLKGRTATPRTMVLLRGTYLYALNADGSCCAYVLIDQNAFTNALFPATATDTSTPVGAAENAGDFRTRDIASFIFPNALLFSNGNPNDCCVIGFHSYDVEAGDQSNGWKERRYVLNFASFLSPGIFVDPTFADVAPLSHEMAETFNDPFVNNSVPWWLGPNGNCQDNLETGDVIEGVPNAQYTISLNGTSWHVQNEALLQWFAGTAQSSAIHHAYSYPDTSILTAASVSQNPGCK